VCGTRYHSPERRGAIPFFYSFKAILFALCCIAAVEVVTDSIGHTTFLERSNLLDAGFNEADSQHRLVIYGKLEAFGAAHPDIVQVGDSSGFHAVDPALLKADLGGLSYINMSCCANMGFDGYHDLAKYMFERNRGIKFLVVYVNVMNFPQRAMLTKSALVNPEMVSKALTDVWPHFNLPSMAYRRDATQYVYTMGYHLGHDRSALHPLYAKFRDHEGWAPAAEPHLTNDEQAAFCHQFFRKNEADFWTTDFLGRSVSYFEQVMDRFYRLTRKNGARLIVVVDLFPCKVDSTWLSNRKADVDRFLAGHSDAVVYPHDVLEHASPDIFAIPIHVLPEHHDVTSKRVGRLFREILQTPIAQ
jgi:hypothetical protein